MTEYHDHPDGFPGSDEGSHFMATRQGFGHVAPPRRHTLKCDKPAFEAVWDGRKTFELRSEHDRTYCEGDVLVLREWCPSEQRFSGRAVFAAVTFIFRGQHILAPMQVLMSIRVGMKNRDYAPQEGEQSDC